MNKNCGNCGQFGHFNCGGCKDFSNWIEIKIEDISEQNTYVSRLIDQDTQRVINENNCYRGVE